MTAPAAVAGLVERLRRDVNDLTGRTMYPDVMARHGQAADALTALAREKAEAVTVVNAARSMRGIVPPDAMAVRALKAEADVERLAKAEQNYQRHAQEDAQTIIDLTAQVAVLEADVMSLSHPVCQRLLQDKRKAESELAALKVLLRQCWGAIEPDCASNHDGECGPNCDLRKRIDDAVPVDVGAKRDTP
jgi:hypothetical protein